MGLDLVDDESKPERRPTKHMPTPAQWTNVFNPAFSYYVYYCYANLYTLNKVFIVVLSYIHSTVALFSLALTLREIPTNLVVFLLCHPEINLYHPLELQIFFA